MASIQKTAKGWRIQLSVRGERDSATFRTKPEAEAWAVRRRDEILALKAGRGGDVKTLRDAIERYRDEVTPSKRGQRWETVRLTSWLTSLDHRALPLHKRLSDLSPEDIAAWRDARQSQRLGGNTILREMGVLSAVLEHTRREWKWITTNPVRDVRKPRTPDHRERVITPGEVAKMCEQMGYSEDAPVTTASQAVAVGFLLAMETGMRCGEVFGLKWSDVHGAYVRLRQTKTVPREVPLSREARRLIERMKGRDKVEVFAVGVKSVDTLFRRARERAGLSGFTFHDSRHSAATRLALKVDALTLCKIFGWKNASQALQYFNPKASDIAERLG